MESKIKRVYGWKKDKVDSRDFLYSEIRPSGIVIPQQTDLRPKCPAVVDQLTLGSCTANALSGGVGFIHPELPPVSRLFIYYNERKAEGTVDQDSGAEIRDGIKSLATQGVCAESVWPYLVEKFKDSPTEEAYQEAMLDLIKSYHRIMTLDEMLLCLTEGFPFELGIQVFDALESEEVAQTGIVPEPGDDDQPIGGHAVMAVGHDLVTKRFIVRNSWGDQWGQAGYFTLPFEYVEKYGDDFWTIRA